MNKVLVLGGTGFVGRTLCEHLVEHGGGAARITVPSRQPHRARALQMLPGLELVEADVHDEQQLTRLLVGQQAVVNLVAILHGSEAAFREAHVELPRKLARACAATGVRRVVHVSALGAAPDAPSRYLRSKAEGEAQLRSAGLDLTVLRPSVIFGADDRFLNLFAQLQAAFPVMPLAGADARFQPVWVADVARAIVHALGHRETIGQAYECTGPRVYTLRELVRLAGRWSGHERPIVPLPHALGRLQALMLECLPGTPLMSRDNLASMRVPNVASGGAAGLADLGIRPTALEAVMPDVLARRGEPARLDSWRRAARRG
ncbi:MAG: complex I NDUFA9 subunit family protein [Rhizobacter sp.]|nr:complex I NDUFA9 subunit family protein [Rhizobacter sp.]